MSFVAMVWSDQVDLAIRQSLGRGMTTLPRLSEQLPKAWQGRLRRGGRPKPTCSDGMHVHIS